MQMIAAVIALRLFACSGSPDIDGTNDAGHVEAADAGTTSTDADRGADAGASDAGAPMPGSLRAGLTMFFPMDETGGVARMDRVSATPLAPWQRTGDGAYSPNGDGTLAVAAAVGLGQHIEGSHGYHFSAPHAAAMEHAGGSFTWAGWASIDAPDIEAPYIDHETLVAKWNSRPDTTGSRAAPDYREYRIWHDHERLRWRFEVSWDGHEGLGHSTVVTHPQVVDRDRLYFVEAWHDADRDTINLRVSTTSARGDVASAEWVHGIFVASPYHPATDKYPADLNIGAQNTCTDDHLEGIVDALGHWNRVLTDGESIALWNDGAGLEL